MFSERESDDRGRETRKIAAIVSLCYWLINSLPGSRLKIPARWKLPQHPKIYITRIHVYINVTFANEKPDVYLPVEYTTRNDFVSKVLSYVMRNTT